MPFILKAAVDVVSEKAQPLFNAILNPHTHSAWKCSKIEASIK